MSDKDKAARLRELAETVTGFSDPMHGDLQDRLEAEGVKVLHPTARYPHWRVDLLGVRGTSRVGLAAALVNWSNAARRAALRLEA